MKEGLVLYHIDRLFGKVPAVDAIPRKRVLFVAHSAFQGGAELCLDTLFRHLDRSTYDAFAVFPWQGPMTDSASELGIPIDLIPLTWWMNWPRGVWYYKNLLRRAISNVYRLVKLINMRQIDLVYTNTVSIWESALAARLVGVPHIWHCHEVLGQGMTKHHLLPMWLHYKLIGQLSDRIIFESKASKHACPLFQVNPKCKVVYNSLRFSPSILELPSNGDRTRFGLREEDRVVAFIGQFCERKDPFTLLRAMARLRNIDGLRCFLVGEGPLQDALQQQILHLGIENMCSLIPFQPDVSSLMRCIDVLVLPSREESFGLVLVEAGAFGKPVIATRTQGPAEIVVDGETGFLVDIEADEQLAAKIELLVNSESERHRMGAAASRRVHELFSPARNTSMIQKLMNDVMGD